MENSLCAWKKENLGVVKMKGFKEIQLEGFAKEIGIKLKEITENRMVEFALPDALIMEIDDTDYVQYLVYWKGVKIIIIQKQPNEWYTLIFSPLEIRLGKKKAKYVETNRQTDMGLMLTLFCLQQAVKSNSIFGVLH